MVYFSHSNMCFLQVFEFSFHAYITLINNETLMSIEEYRINGQANDFFKN